MEIPGNEFRIKSKAIQEKGRVAGKSPAKDVTSPSSVSKTQGTENIALSSKAKDIQKAFEAAKSSPDIRVDKVERIKNSIADGTFHVDSKDLAEKILKDIITESKFLG
ncbi:MAG: flagellar biosynthesis anti-sigma factor FlgM [Nitrospinota bacterium]|nr:flagellar biosynthesis anti-sigma factor FlgM [Nitrospinota bacterium]